MNPVDYLSSVKSLLLNSPLITRYQIIREYEGLQKSYIRARLTLTDDSVLEFSEYIEPKSEDEFKITDYSFNGWTRMGITSAAGTIPRISPNSKTFRITFTSKKMM